VVFRFLMCFFLGLSSLILKFLKPRGSWESANSRTGVIDGNSGKERKGKNDDDDDEDEKGDDTWINKQSTI